MLQLKVYQKSELICWSYKLLHLLLITLEKSSDTLMITWFNMMFQLVLESVAILLITLLKSSDGNNLCPFYFNIIIFLLRSRPRSPNWPQLRHCDIFQRATPTSKLPDHSACIYTNSRHHTCKRTADSAQLKRSRQFAHWCEKKWRCCWWWWHCRKYRL